MIISLEPGDELKVRLDGTDGEFVFAFGQFDLRVIADLADDSGRSGTIYLESWNTPGKDKGKGEVVDG